MGYMHAQHVYAPEITAKHVFGGGGVRDGCIVLRVSACNSSIIYCVHACVFVHMGQHTHPWCTCVYFERNDSLVKNTMHIGEWLVPESRSTRAVVIIVVTVS